MADLDTGALGLAIDHLYEAAAAPELWPAALDVLSRAAGALHSVVFFYEPPVCRWTCSPQMTECVEAFEHEGWHEHDARTRRSVKLLNSGHKIISEEMIFKPGALDREPIQNGLFNRFDLRSFFAFEFVPGLVASVERGHHRIADWERDQLGRCIPHFLRVGRLAQARGLGVSDGAMAVLDTLKNAAIIVDHQGRVLRMNEDAERLCPGILAIRDGVMRPHHSAAVLPFYRMVRQAAAPEITPPTDVIDHVALPRENKRPIVAYGVPLKGVAHDIFQRARAIVMLVDLEGEPTAGASLWSQVFGMTRMEGRVAEQIVEGYTIAEAADTLNLSHHTVRTHLTAVFRKTGTHRQSQLATLLGKMPVSKS